jgi:hypothetical protein
MLGEEDVAVKLRKWMMLAAMLAVVVMATPVVAQVSQEESERRIASGTAAPKTGISNKGSNVNLCAAVLQSAQTGNVANQQGVTQYGSDVDNIEFEGSTITVTPDLVNECTQTIQQVTAAGVKSAAEAGKAEAKGGGSTPSGGAASKAGGTAAKVLPATGGLDVALSLGLGAGAVVVGGGLLARKMSR